MDKPFILVGVVVLGVSGFIWLVRKFRSSGNRGLQPIIPPDAKPLHMMRMPQSQPNLRESPQVPKQSAKGEIPDD